MIVFEKVSKRYPSGHQALSQVDFELKKGEMAFLTGHSGAGKSTLLKLISLIERPTIGRVGVNGWQLNQLPDRYVPMVRRSMGIIFQSPNLLADRTVFDNVALPLVITGCDYHEIKRRVRAALDKVGLLKKEKSQPLVLSSGEQQRVGIARAIVHKPALLLADEPTGNLDPSLSAEIMRLFSDLNQVGVSVLVATHDLALISKMSHRILVLREGKMIS